jgi:hypothetical protein
LKCGADDRHNGLSAGRNQREIQRGPLRRAVVNASPPMFCCTMYLRVLIVRRKKLVDVLLIDLFN